MCVSVKERVRGNVIALHRVLHTNKRNQRNAKKKVEEETEQREGNEDEKKNIVLVKKQK